MDSVHKANFRYLILYLCLLFSIFTILSISWDNLTQKSGIIYWKVDIDPPSYEAISLNCLSDKGLIFIASSCILLMIVQVTAQKQNKQSNDLIITILTLWGIATIIPLATWVFIAYYYHPIIPAPEAVSKLVLLNDCFVFDLVFMPMIIVQIIISKMLKSVKLKRIAVFYALLSVLLVFLNYYHLDANCITEHDLVQDTFLLCARLLLPIGIALFSYITVKTINSNDSAVCLMKQPQPVLSNQKRILCPIGFLWLIWACIHLAIHNIRIHRIIESIELLGGPLVDGTISTLNSLVFFIIGSILLHKVDKRFSHVYHPKAVDILSSWIYCFLIVILYEEFSSIFLQSISYDEHVIRYVNLSSILVIEILPLLFYITCSVFRTSRIFAILSFFLLLIVFCAPALIVDYSVFHIISQCVSLLLPPIMLLTYSLMVKGMIL